MDIPTLILDAIFVFLGLYFYYSSLKKKNKNVSSIDQQTLYSSEYKLPRSRKVRLLLGFGIIIFMIAGVSINHLPISQHSRTVLGIIWILILFFFLKFVRKSRINALNLSENEKIKYIENESRLRNQKLIVLILVFILLYFIFNPSLWVKH